MKYLDLLSTGNGNLNIKGGAPVTRAANGAAPNLQGLDANKGKTLEVSVGRKKRSDAGSTDFDKELLMIAGSKISLAKVSSYKQMKKNFGYKKVYEEFFVEAAKERGLKVPTYRHFITLCFPFVDRDVQARNNLGDIRYRNLKQLTHHHDYSIYEPMEMIQSDHTPCDCVCKVGRRVLRMNAAFHDSLGDRILSYPTITESPDSFSLADNLLNFVFKYGLSTQPVIYKTDNGKPMVSKLMTKNGVIEEEYKGYDIEERHLQAMRMMGLGVPSDKGVYQNIGVIEKHALPRRPRGKQIERQFAIGGTMDWFVDRPEYTGRNRDEKPERLEKIIKSGNVWTAEEMLDFMIDKVDKYNNREHQGIKKESSGMFAVPHLYNLDLEYFQSNTKFLELTTGYIPDTMQDVYRLFNDAAFAKDQLQTNLYSPIWRRRIFELCGWQSRAIPSKEMLAMLVMKSETRTVKAAGIQIGNLMYINYDLHSYIGKEIIIRYSPSNIIRIKEQSGKRRIFIREVYVFIKVRERGQDVEKFICIATPHPATVTGLKIEGYAKEFLDKRNTSFQETTYAKKIITGFANERETAKESAFTPTILQLDTYHDLGAKDLAKAIKVKEEKVITKEKEYAQLEKDMSEITGDTTYKVGEQ